MSKKNYVVFLLMIFTHATGFTQSSILFINTSKNKIIHAHVGDQLSIRYKGYLGQTESYKHNISMITDSSVCLGVYFADLSIEQNLTLSNIGFGYKEILLKDIISFRRMSVGRTLLKSTLSLGAAIGSIVVLSELYAHSNLSTPAKFGISLGVGISTTYLINLLISDRPKYLIKDGWKIETLK